MSDDKKQPRVGEVGRILESHLRFEGRTIQLVTERVVLPNGNEIEIDIVRHPGAAAIVALDDDGSIVMVRVYRHALREWQLEVPAGKLAAGEDVEASAKRELAEETGVRARTWRGLGSIVVSPGFCDERVWLFLATDLTRGEQELEENEVILVERLPLAEAERRALAGEIVDSKSACAILRAAALLRTA